MTRFVASPCLVAAFVLLGPATSLAQDVPLSRLLVNLVQAEVRLAPPPPGFQSHEAHFLPGTDQQIAPYLFNQQLVAQLATFPTSAPTGGFSFTFDPALGTFQRATESFGPTFADRALTNGRSRLTVGASFQRSKYSSFEGSDLESGEVKFFLDHQDIPGNIFFEGDIVEASLRLDLTSSTTTLFANYGITNNLDVAVAVPIVRVSMDASVNAVVRRLATGEASPIHTFPNGTNRETFSDDGAATGVGDILVRSKVRFFSVPGGGLAAGLDVKLPSGDSENLLGSGAVGATVSLIGSSSMGRLAPHFNVAFTGSGDSDVVNLSNEFQYRLGTEIIAAPTLTLSAEIIGRSLIDAGRLQLAPRTRSFFNQAGVVGSVTQQEYDAVDGSLNLLSLVLGGKFNVAGNFLINANVLIALTDSGVTARFTPVVGFDYAF